jgi:hypothetical protein
MRVRQAIETLFEGFKSSDRVETAWARRLLGQPDPSESDIQAEILLAVERYCPNVPEEFVPFVVELLGAGIRLARRDEEFDMQIVSQSDLRGFPAFPLRDTSYALHEGIDPLPFS